MSTADFLETIRLVELRQIEAILGARVPGDARILEIGAGTGWQSRELAERGYQVFAIDIPTSNHGKGRIWPIIDFDGRHIPFANAGFDVVYSSNVLEHVEDIATLNAEMARVLRPGGYAIHYVPTSAWRAWSLLAFYPALFLDAWGRMRGRLFPEKGRIAETAGAHAPPSAPFARKLVRRILPHAHGAQGTYWTELARFKRGSWDRLFTESGWSIDSYGRNEMFLTGEMLMGKWLPVAWRKRLSSMLGCTAHLYVLRRTVP